MGFCAAGLHTRRANSGKVSVLRYLGYLLMVVAVLALAGTAAVCLFGGLAEQLRVPGSVRIIALDEAATTQAPYLRVGAKIEDLDYGRPIPYCHVVLRYDDGWRERSYTDPDGLVRWSRRGPLPAGRHPYTVMFPETHPRADIQARATVWVSPAGVGALWVDAAALSPETKPGGQPSNLPQAEAMRPALEALKALAKGQQVVYLVAADIAEYQAVRERLDEAGAPPGPVIWLRKGNELERLKILRDSWRDVDGAVVVAPVVADAVAKLKVRVVRLPRAGEQADAAPQESGQREAARRTGEGK
jgi:hypothetical protein